MKRSRAVFLLGLAAVTALAAAALRDVAWERAARSVGAADGGLLLAALALNATILALSAAQWLLFLPGHRSVRPATMLWISAVASTASNGGPFMAGHAAGVHLLATRGGTGHAAAVGVKALDQIAEGLAKLMLVGAAAYLAPLPPALRTTALGIFGGVAVLAGGAAALAARGTALHRLAQAAPHRLRPPLRFAATVAEELAAPRPRGRLVAALALAAAQKVAEGAALWAVAAGLGVAVPAWGIVLALAAVNLSTMVSVTPANAGIYEAAAVAAYRAAGVDLEPALGLAVLQHLCYLLPMAGAGWVAVAVDGRRAFSGDRGTHS